MLTSVTLVDGTRSMSLVPREGLRLQGMDVPMPAPREVVEERTDDDGEDDDTELFGGASCTLEILATQTPAGFVEELGRFLHPRSRPYLVVADDEWAQQRRLQLRVSQFGKPRTIDLPRHMRKIQAQWKVPDGVWESVDLVEETINADVAITGGRSYPETYPRTYTTTTSTGAAQISNAGNAPAHHITRLYGPCVGPRLVNETLGEEITFTDSLTIAAGDYVEIDTRNKTAYLLSNTTAPRLSFLDFEVSDWWQIEPGDQSVRYAPTSISGAAAAVITYRPAWIT